MPAVNPLAVPLDGAGMYDVAEIRVAEEISDVRTYLHTLAPASVPTDARLRQELTEALVTSAALKSLTASDVVFGQPLDVVTRTPSLSFRALDNGNNLYALNFQSLPRGMQILSNNKVIGSVPAGTNEVTLSFSSPWYARETLTFKDVVTGQLQGGSLEIGLNMYTNKIAVTDNRLSFSTLAYQESRPMAQTGSSLAVEQLLNDLVVDLRAVWSPSSSSALTQAEFSAAKDRLRLGTAQDATTLKNVLTARAGVEAVVSPALTFSATFNNQGRQVLLIDGTNLPEHSRLVVASDPWLKQVVDERSLLPGSGHVEFTWQSGANYVGLVDANGDLLAQSYSLSIENNWLVVRQGQQTVGQTGSRFSPVTLPGVSVPLTKESLTAVSPQARLIVSGQSADLRFEWLPAGAVIEGLTDTPVVAAGGTLNVPVFTASGTQRAVTVRAADGTTLMDRHIVGSDGNGGFVFYRWSATAEPVKLITADSFGMAQLATREQIRTVEAGRNTLAARPTPVFPAGSTEANRAWGLQVAGMAGIDLTMTRSAIARGFSSLVALWEDDRSGFYAEVDRRFAATPIQNGRKIETAGMIEQGMKGIVFDAYARADEILRNAQPVLADLTIAAFLNVQATRTDVPKPPDLSQVRTFTLQAQNAAPYLPSNQTLLAALGAQFEPIRAYLAGEMQTWRTEVDQASNAGRFTSDPNPGLRLPPSKQQTAYETALGAVSEAERNYRLASAAGEPRRLSAATVALATAKADLTRAEQAWRLWQQQNRSTPEVSPQVLPEGGEVLTLSKSALERLLSGLPQKLQSVTARLTTATDQRLVQELTAERAHWLALQEAATGLLALVPATGTYPTIVGTQAEAWARYLGESVSGGTIETFVAEGMGGAFDATIESPEFLSWERLLAVTDVRRTPHLGEAGVSLSRETLGAKVLAWYLTNYDALSQTGNLDYLVATASRYTGIDPIKILMRSQTSDAVTRTRNLAELWINAGFADSASIGNVGAPIGMPQFFQQTLDLHLLKDDAVDDGLLDWYTDFTDTWTGPTADVGVQIRLDVGTPLGAKAYDHVSVYLLDATGKQGENPLMTIKEGLTVTVPFSAFHTYLGEFGGPIGNGVGSFSGGVFRLKVVAWMSNDANDRVTKTTEQFHVALDARGPSVVPNGALSTLAEGDPDKGAEAAIFSQLGAHSPVRLTDGDWYVEMGSGAHDDQPFHSFFAMDINLSGETDRNHDVLAVAEGTITRLDLTYGTIVIDHSATASVPEWQSKYLHTSLYATERFAPNGNRIYEFHSSNGSVVPGLEVWEGKHVNADDRIAIIGGRGPSAQGDAGTDEDAHAISDGAFNAHLHFEAVYLGTSRNIANVAQSAWGMEIYGSNVFEKQHFAITWSTAVTTPGSNGAWVNEENKLIFFRDIKNSTDTQTDYWLAWQDGIPLEQMKRVVWDSDSNTWLQWDATQGTWAIENGHRQQWCLIDGYYQFSPL